MTKAVDEIEKRVQQMQAQLLENQKKGDDDQRMIEQLVQGQKDLAQQIEDTRREFLELLKLYLGVGRNNGGILPGKPIDQRNGCAENGECSHDGRGINVDNSRSDYNHERASDIGGQIHIPKLEIPFFSEGGPRRWLRRCEKDFQVHGVVDLDWKEFSDDFDRRFGKGGFENIVDEFNKLAQKGLVIDYIHKFEDLRASMLKENPYMTEVFFVYSFLDGLDEEIKDWVRVQKPKTLPDAYEQALLHEKALRRNRRTNQPDMEDCVGCDNEDEDAEAMIEESSFGDEGVDGNESSCSMDCSTVVKVKQLHVTPESALLYLDLPSSVLMAEAVQPLIDAANHYFVQRFKDMTKFQEEVIALPLAGIEAIPSSDYLHVASEDAVYDFVLEWAEHHYRSALNKEYHFVSVGMYSWWLMRVS